MEGQRERRVDIVAPATSQLARYPFREFPSIEYLASIFRGHGVAFTLCCAPDRGIQKKKGDSPCQQYAELKPEQTIINRVDSQQ